jgi:hypothetical protein
VSAINTSNGIPDIIAALEGVAQTTILEAEIITPSGLQGVAQLSKELNTGSARIIRSKRGRTVTTVTYFS